MITVIAYITICQNHRAVPPNVDYTCNRYSIGNGKNTVRSVAAVSTECFMLCCCGMWSRLNCIALNHSHMKFVRASVETNLTQNGKPFEVRIPCQGIEGCRHCMLQRHFADFKPQTSKYMHVVVIHLYHSVNHI